MVKPYSIDEYGFLNVIASNIPQISLGKCSRHYPSRSEQACRAESVRARVPWQQSTFSCCCCCCFQFRLFRRRIRCCHRLLGSVPIIIYLVAWVSAFSVLSSLLKGYLTPWLRCSFQQAGPWLTQIWLCCLERVIDWCVLRPTDSGPFPEICGARSVCFTHCYVEMYGT